MADIQSNIQLNIEASQALSQLKALQRQLSNFHASIATTSAAAAKAQANLQTNLINSVNATGKFRASLQEVKSTADSFTTSLEKNQFSTREYFRYAGGATKTFGKLFKSEYDTIGKVSEERLKTMQTQYIKMGRAANGAIQSIAIRPLALDMDNLATKTALAAQKQQLFGQLLKQGSTNLLNFGKNTQWAGRQLMVGFTVPLAMLGTTAAKTFMELEKQAIRFKRVYGELFTTSGETDKALKDVQLLAKEFLKYGVAIQDTMSMAADAAATGKQGADLLAQVSEATRLAVLGNIEQNQALETTISLTNAFGIQADQLKGKIDFLNAVENQTVLNIEDLTIAIPKAAPVIRQLGGDVEDLAFFMTAMKEGGINASEGANALKSGLASLINPSKKAAGFLQDLGINLNGIVEANKGNIKNTVVQFAQALDTLDPLNRARAIEQLFGKFQFSRLSTLFQNITKDGTQASRTLDLAGASVEELAILSERELAKVENATGTKFKKSLEGLKLALAPVGEQFLKAVTPIVEFFGKILEKFNGLGDGTKKAIVVMVAAIGLIGPAVLMTFGLIANGAANIIKLFLTMRNGFLGLGKQSNFLGNQTQYLTSQQIEANAIASSLDQTHSRLIQTFTSEAGAANTLATAYERANVAGSNFARINPGMMQGGKAPKKFASGGIVPGTGNQDTVPAVLTPGEFVVNKKATQENRSFLQKLNMGGFVLRNKGTSGKPGYFKNIQDPWAGEVKGAQGYDPTLPKMRPGSIEYAKAAVAKQQQEDSQYGLGQIQASALHFDDSKLIKDPKTGQKVPNSEVRLHDSGVLSGRKKYAGYTILGNQAYNQATNNRTLASNLPSPYPLSHKDAVKSLAEFDNILTKTMDPSTRKNMQLARRFLLEDLKIMPNPKSWTDGMASRYSRITSIAAGEKGTGPVEKASRKSFIDASLSSQETDMIKRQVKAKADILWKQGILSDSGMEKKTGSSSSASHLKYKESMSISLKNILKHLSPDEQKAILNTGATQRNRKASMRPSWFKPIRGGRFLLRASGGIIPGYGEKDTVPALLTPGEFVVNKKATQENGPILEAMNSGTMAKREDGTQPNPFANIGPSGERTTSSGLIIPAGYDPYENVGKQFEQKTTRSVRSLTDIVGKSIDGMGQGIAKGFKALGQRPMAIASDEEFERATGTGGRSGRSRFSVGSRFSRNSRGVDPQTEEAQRIRSQKMMQRSNMLMMSTYAASGALSMMGNDIAKKFTPALGALSMGMMGMQMIQGPVSGAIAGMVAIGATAVMVRRAFDKAQDKALEMGDALGAGAKSTRALAEAAGKVSATEQMDRRRSSKFSIFQIQTGKSTFGENYVQSEAGKNLMSTFGGRIKSLQNEKNPQAKAIAQQELSNQLSTGVVSGAISTEQARSIAANIGKQLGDFSFGINVSSQLTELLGPNGENVLKDPLQIRVRMLQETRMGLEDPAKRARDAGGVRGTDVIGSIGYTAAGAGAGAAAGAMIGSMIAPGIGTAVGAVLGTAVGAVSGAIYGQKERQRRIGEASGSSVAMQKIALEQQQELLDSYDLENEKKIKILETEGKLKEAASMRAKYEQGRQVILNENAQTNTAILNAYKNSEGATQKSLMGASRKAAERKYKGTALADVATSATSAIGDLKLNNEQKYTLNLQLASGQLNPMQILDLASIFKNDKAGQEKFFTISTKFGGAVANEALAVAGMFVDATGKPIDNVQKNLIAKVSASTNGKEAQRTLDFYNNIAKTGSVFNLKVMSEFLQNNPEEAIRIQGLVESVQKQKGEITLSIATEILGAGSKELGALKSDLDYFQKLPPSEQKIYLTALIEGRGTFDVNDPQFKAWQAEKGLTTKGDEVLATSRLSRNTGEKVISTGKKVGDVGKQANQYLTEGAAKLVKGSADKTTGVGKGKGGGGDGKRDTTYDDMLKKLKLVQNSTINAIGGAEELKRVMGKGASLTQFEGIDQTLMGKTKGKVSKDFLDFVDAMSPEGLQKNLQKVVSIAADGEVKFTALGNAIQKGLLAGRLGEYQSGMTQRIAAIKNETNATSVLVKAGFTYAEAQRLATDETIALAIANKQLSPQELEELLKQTQKLTKAQKEYETVTKIALMDEMDGQVARFNIVEKFVALQEKLIENQYVSEQSVLKSKQDANNYNLDLISRQEEKVNKQYDAQITALEQINKLNEQANELQSKKISIASAFASGDIGAAATAMQEYRNAQIANSAKTRMEALQKAKQNAISSITSPNGLTRSAIEADNVIIANRLTDIEENIRVAKDKLDVSLKDTLGLTRVEIAAAGSAIKLALEAGVDPNDSKFLGNILKNVKGDADITVTALNSVTASIKAANAAMVAAKAKYADEKYSDQIAKEEAARAAALAAGNTPPVGTTPSSGSSPGYVAIGSTFYPINNNLPSKNAKATAQAAAQEKTRNAFLKSIGIPGFMSGGMVPKYFAKGGFNKGTDIVPAMLTPGEFVVNRKATQQFGPLLSAINSPTFKTPDSMSSSVRNSNGSQTAVNNSKTLYNYNLSVNVNNSGANPNDIARTVINQIKQIDNQRVRSL